MAPPPFSTLTAVSEIAVTLAVFYAFWPALRGGMYRGGLLAVALLYEFAFNITYMARRLVEFGLDAEIEPGLVALAAFHGALSGVMFLGLVGFALAAWVAQRDGRNLPAEHRGFTLGFLGLWIVSVGSGEILYASLYF